MSIGLGQLLLIALVVFIIFGAGKLPSMMGDFAKGIRAFKKGLSDEEGVSSQTQESTVTYDLHANQIEKLPRKRRNSKKIDL